MALEFFQNVKKNKPGSNAQKRKLLGSVKGSASQIEALRWTETHESFVGKPMISHSEGNLKNIASVNIPVLLKALCQTEFFTDLGLTKHFFDKENKDMAKLINQVWALTPFYSFYF